MKRPYQNIRAAEEDMNDVAPNTSDSPPIVIEVDDCACNSEEKPALKRARITSSSYSSACDCNALNLLIKAVERVSRSSSTNSSTISIVDRVPSMCHEIPAVTDSRSPSATDGSVMGRESRVSMDDPSPVPLKSIVYLKPPSFPPVLPKGRPLMAPPRLPTNLQPGQILLRNTAEKNASSSPPVKKLQQKLLL
jgi:hypothetical protein